MLLGFDPVLEICIKTHSHCTLRCDCAAVISIHSCDIVAGLYIHVYCETLRFSMEANKMILWLLWRVAVTWYWNDSGVFECLLWHFWSEDQNKNNPQLCTWVFSCLTFRGLVNCDSLSFWNVIILHISVLYILLSYYHELNVVYV